MVDRISRLGYQSWFIQRMTALLSGIYGVFIVVFLWVYHPISYLQWHALFDHWLVKIMTLIVIFNVLLHAWIGLWTIFTDYVKNKLMRLVFQTVICLLLIAYFIWAIEFFWIVC